MTKNRNKLYSDAMLVLQRNNQNKIDNSPTSIPTGLGMNEIKTLNTISVPIEQLEENPYNTYQTNQYNTEPTNEYQNQYTNANNTGDPMFDQVSLLVRQNEVGDPNKFQEFGNVHDGAGITAGAYQFTEKSGILGKLSKRLGFNSIYDKGFRQALGSPQGIQEQHKLFKETFYDPAVKIAQNLGINDPKTIAFLIDTNLNGGMHSVINRARKKGTINLNTLVSARNDRYRYLAESNPAKYGKFLAGWLRRSNSFLHS